MKTRFRSITERAITYSLIVISAGLLVYNLGSVNRARKAEINSKQQELLKLQDMQKKLEEDAVIRQRQVDSTTKLVDERSIQVTKNFENLLESSGNYTNFINQIQHKANSLEIKIQDSTYLPPTRASQSGLSYLEFQFNLTIQGSYSNIKQFLWELENALERMINISQLEILSPLANAENKMSLKLQLTTFFLP